MFLDFCGNKIFGWMKKQEKKKELRFVKKALIEKVKEAKEHEKILWSL